MQSTETSIRVSKIVHQALVSHLLNTDRKLGKFAEAAITEKIERENKKKKDNE